MKVNVCKRFLVTVFIFYSLQANAQNPQLRAETMRQIGLLMQEKESRTPTQRKIDSRLLQATREQRGQKMAAGVTLEPVDVGADATGYLKVDISAEVSDELISKIESFGGKIIYPSWEYHTIRANIKLSSVEAVAALPGVKFVEPAVRSSTVGAGLTANVVAPKKEKPSAAERQARVVAMVNKYLEKYKTPAPFFFTGPVNSQGDRTHRTDEVRNTYGYLGQGIKIGVISDSYNKLNGAAADVSNGELPGTGNRLGNTVPVAVVQDNDPNGSDEGRAMLQIVHDIAPKAQLFFATGSISAASMATNILALKNTYNCDIIVDDIFYYDEPAFQDGSLAQAVNTVTAAGVLYFSSAGNAGSLAKNTSGYYEGDFVDGGPPAFANPKTGTIHNFGTAGNPVDGDAVITAGLAYVLTWADKLGASSNDYDLFLVSSSGTVKGMSNNIQNGTQNPVEVIATFPTLVSGDKLVVFKTASALARAFTLNTTRGKLAVATAGETHGHASAVDAFCIAASPAAVSFGVTGSTTGPYPSVFSASSQVETFSSDGPRRIFYDASGNQINGSLLFGTNGGTVLNKPDFTAADGVSTTLGSGLNPFFGTSAAAPHAAAIAALMKCAKPTITKTELYNFFKNTALDIEGAGNDINSGNGIIQAYQAMQSLNPAALSSISLGTVTSSEGTFSNSNGNIDPGETGKFVIQLTNATATTATNVNAVLSTSTTGVTITQGSVSYGSVNGGSNAINTSSPFTFAVASTVPCGTVIKFFLTVSFGGGSSPQAFLLNVNVGAQAGANISSTLGNTPPTGGTYVSSSGTQTGRLTRANTGASTCAAVRTNSLFETSSPHRYDAYKFTNGNSDQCVTVTLDATNGANLYTAAYKSSYVPATPTTNFLADPSASGVSVSYSFVAQANQSFVVVVHDVPPGTTSGIPYALSVSYNTCSSGPACTTPVTMTTASLANGTANVAYSQPLTASGGSGGYTFSTASTLPSGISINGNNLSGTPTQTGNFSITITANDPLGCTAGSKNYNLLISSAASITASAGASQTTQVSTAFPVSLQATVLNSSGNPAANATVVFTAPGTGASAVFSNSTATINATTNANGVATVPVTANAVTGTYTVTASVTGIFPSANFILTNSVGTCSITCPSNIIVSNTTNQCGAIVNFALPTTSGSGCGTVTTSPASGSFFPIGTTTVTAMATGGATCSFTVKVNDTQAPVITCGGNITVNNTTDQCGAIVNFPAPTATDNCTALSVVSSPASGSFFPVGVTTVTNTATDAAGNTSSCTFTVTVKNNQTPTIVCPSNIVVNNDVNQCGAIVNIPAPVVTGSCVTVAFSPTATFLFPIGVTTVTAIATDVSGSKASCNFTITVKDVQLPVITCPSNIVVGNTANQCGAVVVFAAPIVSDNCPGATVVSVPASGSFFPKGTTTVTSTATDASGNQSTCSFTVTVNDVQPPVITCPANITANNQANQCGATVTYTTPTATDNCPGVTVVTTPASGSFFPIGVTTVTSTATDASGNIATCNFTVTINDTKPPVIATHPLNAIACPTFNASFSVTANAAVSYQWQVNSGSGFTDIAGATNATLTINNITVAMNGNQYRVKVTGTCTSVFSNPAVLTVNPLPSVVLVASPLTNLKPGEQTTITATTVAAAGGSLIWTKDGATIAGAVSRTIAGINIDGLGTYKTTYTDANGCVAVSPDFVIGATPTDNLFIYPNPNNGHFQVRYYTATATTLQVNINDSKGARLFSKQFAAAAGYTKMDIEIATVASGLYVVELLDKDGKRLDSKKIFIIP